VKARVHLAGQERLDWEAAVAARCAGQLSTRFGDAEYEVVARVHIHSRLQFISDGGQARSERTLAGHSNG
jgi:hypothetical protein